MQILEATIAFALTMAALATIVTIIMEAGMRVTRMRKKNLVEVIKLLNKELETGPFELNHVERWQFIENTISNPANAATDSIRKVLTRKLHIKPGDNHLFNTRNQAVFDAQKCARLDIELNEILNLLGSDKSAGKNIIQRVWHYFWQLFHDRKRSSLYDKVSLEHVLRRLAEVDTVQKRAAEASEPVKTELNRLALKFEEYASATSANFKRYAMIWSVVVGILFAIFANIDGLRIFNAYLASPDLAQTVISQHEQLRSDNTKIETTKKDYEEAVKTLSVALKKLDDARKELENAKTGKTQNQSNLQARLDAAQKEYDDRLAALNELNSPEQINTLFEDAQKQYASLISLGMPLGWDFYPDCPYGDSEAWEKSDAKCRINAAIQVTTGSEECNDSRFDRLWTTFKHDTAGFIEWWFKCFVTGLLIGLGAPFWFDVAKRLASIRKGIRSAASSEDRLSANDANGDPNKRKAIVANVVMDNISNYSLTNKDSQ